VDTLEVGGSPQIGGRGAEKRESGFGRDVEIPVDLAGSCIMCVRLVRSTVRTQS